MDKSLLVRVAAVMLALVLTATATDRLVNIDLAAKLLTVDTGAGLKSYRFKESTEVSIDGKRSAPEQLRPGMGLTVTLLDLQTQTVSRIAAIGSVPAPSAPAAPPIGSLTTGSLQHHLHIRIRVDGNEILKIKDGSLWIEHPRFSLPTDIMINGVRWNPQWTNNRTENFVSFNPPLAPFGGAKVEVRKVRGRDTVELKEAPTDKNDQTLVVHVQDTPKGADVYEFQIDW